MNDEIVLEIDDFLPQDHADYIEDALLKSRLFPWQFNDNTVSNEHNDDERNIPGFFNLIYDFQRPQKNEYFDLINPIALQMSSKTGLEFREVIRIQANLICPVNTEGHHLPHLDFFDHHYVAIYYVNDSDGDTYLFENTNKEYNLDYDVQITKDRSTNWPVKKRITPKKGKLVLFNGYRYHSSSSPKQSNYRSLININIR